jgi:hypothetical protein
LVFVCCLQVCEMQRLWYRLIWCERQVSFDFWMIWNEELLSFRGFLHELRAEMWFLLNLNEEMCFLSIFGCRNVTFSSFWCINIKLNFVLANFWMQKCDN